MWVMILLRPLKQAFLMFEPISESRQAVHVANAEEHAGLSELQDLVLA